MLRLLIRCRALRAWIRPVQSSVRMARLHMGLTVQRGAEAFSCFHMGGWVWERLSKFDMAFSAQVIANENYYVKLATNENVRWC